MEQKLLNSARIDEWEYNGLYDEKFRLKLTAKHCLAVGRWHNDKEWGVDLRRWSYDKARLLGEGLTLNSEDWQLLHDIIFDFYKKGYFTDYGKIQEDKYVEEIKIEENFLLRTKTFEGSNKKFLCINITDKNGKLLWRARHAILGIMLLFTTVPDFLTQCKTNNLVTVKEENLRKEKKIDKKTGREIF